MKFLITGAGGFIGRHLVRRLLQDRHEVVALLHHPFASGCFHADAGEVVYGDLSQPASLDWLRRRADIDVVVHLAAYNETDPETFNHHRCIQVNVLGTLNLVQSLPERVRLIFCSTGLVYGRQSGAPWTEDHRPCPDGTYAITKLLGETEVLQRRMGISLVARLFNTYGPAQSIRAVVAKMIDHAVRHEPLEVYCRYQLREFLHVDDAVDGLVRLSLLPERKINAAVFNLACGRPRGLFEVATEIKRLTNSCSDIVVRPSGPHNAFHMCGSNHLAFRTLGWRPEVSFAAGLRRTVESFTRKDADAAPASTVVSAAG